MNRETNERVAGEVFGEEYPPERPVVTDQVRTVTKFETYPWKAGVPGYAAREGWAGDPPPQRANGPGSPRCGKRCR